MPPHAALTLLACLGHLALALLSWMRRAQSRLALVLAALFLDAFAWNFADLAHSLTGAREWALVDRSFSSLMPALGLHVVVIFVGKARALQRAVLAAYAAFGSLALLHGLRYAVWWKLLLGGAAVVMLYAAYLLLVHLRRTSDAAERRRTELVLVAFAIGTLLGSSDVWFDKVGVPLLPLSNVGTLAAMGAFALAVLRLGLLGVDAIPRVLVAYALVLAVASVTGYLAVARWLSGGFALAVFTILTASLLALASWREFGRAHAVAAERTQRLAVLGRFSEQLAHDLRNPLSALKGSLQFLAEERAQGRSLGAHPEFLELMLEQTQRLERTVLGYQRLARVEPAPTRMSLNGIVQEVMSSQRLALPAPVKLQAALDATLPDCALDRDLVATALENLVRNACEAMPKGGTITVSTGSDGLAVPAYVTATVQDDGPGMDPRALERAAEEFYTTKAGGSGLGLSFAARVAKAHGGGMEIESELGRGTRVRMRFGVG